MFSNGSLSLFLLFFSALYFNKSLVLYIKRKSVLNHHVSESSPIRVHHLVSKNRILDADPFIEMDTVYSNAIINQTKPLLCIASTVMNKKKKTKMVAQRNSIVSLNQLPFVKAVFYTNESFWLSYCQRNGYVCDHTYTANEYGTPFFKSLIQRIQEAYDCDFYGYVNGDILFHSNLTRVLAVLKTYIREHRLKERILITGRRTNIFNNQIHAVKRDVDYNDAALIEEARDGSLFREDALDYFIFTNTTYDWNNVPDVVIGRPLYDNHLLHLISSDEHADLVDVTPSAIHQTDEDGIFAGHRKRPDLNWNRLRIGKAYTMGNTNFSDYRLYPNYNLTKCIKRLPYSLCW